MSAIYQNGVWYAPIGVHTGFTPVGTIISVMGVTAPMNYLACNGQVVNITDYPELAIYFETQFGSKNKFGGNGTTTFRIPDLRGEFLRGTGTNSHSGQGSGSSVGTHQDGTKHTWISGVSNIAVGDHNLKNDAAYNADSQSSKIKGRTVTGSVTTGTYPPYYTSRPTNTSVLYCIATKNIFMDAGSNYSTEEQVVGTWINGKPLYQKTLTGTTPASTDSKNGSAAGKCILSIDASIDMGYITHGFLIASSNILQPINGIINSTSEGLRLFANVHINNATSDPNTVVIFNSHILWINRPVYVTIQYTKTTD